MVKNCYGNEQNCYGHLVERTARRKVLMTRNENDSSETSKSHRREIH